MPKCYDCQDIVRAQERVFTFCCALQLPFVNCHTYHTPLCMKQHGDAGVHLGFRVYCTT